MEQLLNQVVPRLAPGCSFACHPMNGKQALKKKLKQRLLGYRDWLPPDWRLIILIDEDREDCHEIKSELSEIVKASGLQLVVGGNLSSGQVSIRIAIEELEAWLLGDQSAVLKAFPRVHRYLHKESYRDPDQILGGTWEALERLLQRSGYYGEAGMPKTEVARLIGTAMNPQGNVSQSFCAFRDLLMTA